VHLALLEAHSGGELELGVENSLHDYEIGHLFHVEQ
jgi:hypothetical protein